MGGARVIYYRLTAKSNDSIDMTDDWYGINYPPRLYCALCGEAHPVNGPLERLPMDTHGGQIGFQLPLEHISGVNYEVVRDDLLEAFGPECREYLRLGELTDENDRRVPQYQTAMARIAVLVRGGPGSGDLGLCAECGRRIYFPMPPGEGYLLRANFPHGVPILRVQVGNFAVNQTIHDRIVSAGLAEGMIIHPLPVLDVPDDGFAVDLAFYGECRRR